MKKYVVRLILCFLLLVCLVLSTTFVHLKMDSFVAETMPIKETMVPLQMNFIVDLTQKNTTPQKDNNSLVPIYNDKYTKPVTSTDPSDATDPTVATNPDGSTNPTEETNPGETTAPTTTTTAVTTAPTGPSATGVTETSAPPTTAPTTVPPTTEPAPEGTLAPATLFYDAEGNALSIESFKDKPVVLCYWGSWASGSEDTLNLMQEIYDLYSDRLSVVAVNLSASSKESREAADAYWAEKGYSFPTYYDNDRACQNAYGIETVPTTFFLQEDCWAVAYFTGKLTRYGARIGLGCILTPEA